MIALYKSCGQGREAATYGSPHAREKSLENLTPARALKNLTAARAREIIREFDA